MQNPLHVNGDLIFETHDYAGWVRIDLRVGTRCAAQIHVQVEGHQDIDKAIEVACKALANELKREYRG